MHNKKCLGTSSTPALLLSLFLQSLPTLRKSAKRWLLPRAAQDYTYRIFKTPSLDLLPFSFPENTWELLAQIKSVLINLIWSYLFQWQRNLILGYRNLFKSYEGIKEWPKIEFGLLRKKTSIFWLKNNLLKWKTYNNEGKKKGKKVEIF